MASEGQFGAASRQPSGESRFASGSEVVHTSLTNDEAVLLSLERQKYFSLNQTGARIWELICEGRTLDEISANLESRFDVTAKKARDSVRNIVADLLAAGLITPLSSPN